MEGHTCGGGAGRGGRCLPGTKSPPESAAGSHSCTQAQPEPELISALQRLLDLPCRPFRG